ncbi:MAG: hypothetical protein JXB62_03935 [Pirellulales bacterium]|nr:hypothetical protein [Pirellulales bacterium]
MDRKALTCLTLGILVISAAGGCQSPYRADQGALFGGLLGAGTGAIIGDAVGNAGAGTAIGAGVGALTGAAIGSELDQIEAQNRAAIAQQLGREVPAGAVTPQDVVYMTQAGVDDELIVNHVRIHGAASPLQPSDLIYLQQQNVSTSVIKAMQTPPTRQTQTTVVREAAPPPVVVQEYHYAPAPYWWGPPRYRRPVPMHPRHRPGVSWGLSFHN